MNKKLLAVAVGAAVLGAPMMANAAATVYGAVHLSVDNYRDAGANGPLTDQAVTTLSSNSSFIGLKAEDDIGGGVKGIVGLEWQMGFDQNNSTSATVNAIQNRNVFVGLQGGFGTLRLGQFDDAVKQVGRKVDLFHSEQIGESRSVVAGNGMDARINNGVRYDSPKLGPVSLNAHYGFANNSDQNGYTDATTWILGMDVNMGGFYIGGAFKDVDVAIAGPGKESRRGWRVAAQYAAPFGLTVSGLYQMFHDPNTNANDWKAFGGGASMKVGNGVIKTQYYVLDNMGDTNTLGAKLVAGGYDHNLSKNTMVYAVYGVVRNQSAGTSTIIGAGHSNPTDGPFPAAVAGYHQSALSVGMKVKF